MVDDFQNRYRSNKVKVSYEEKKAVYQHISKENARITQRLKAKYRPLTKVERHHVRKPREKLQEEFGASEHAVALQARPSVQEVHPQQLLGL
jgi:hypothetical protein